MLMGGEERDLYRDYVSTNRDILYEELGLPHEGNQYYVIFDLNSIEGTVKKDVPIEQKLEDLAKLGIVLIPAYMFFSASDRAKHDLKNMVRASMVNTTPEKIRKTGIIIREYLRGKMDHDRMPSKLNTKDSKVTPV